MELLTPDKNDIISIIKEFDVNSLQQVEKIFKSKKDKVHNALNSYGFRTPAGILRRRAQEVDNILYKIIQCSEKNILIKNNRLSLLVKSLESHDIQRTLKKGFVLVKQDSKFISRSENLKKEMQALLKFYDGEVTVKISE